MPHRKEYIERIKRKLDEWDGELDRLEDKAKQARDEVQQQWAERRPELEQVLRDLEMRVKNAHDSVEENWEETRSKLESGWERLSRELKTVTDRLFPGN
ncbi:hypothetical protein K8B33_04570 [Alcanivorax sp. JB21]|uniref:hypothetical protein n=1 Tax=Alcanivorax limicola TaxID=2874102 RepID=UPI001CBEF086|nr:hypothetical protein [Alcanivorax limicola]MBZ2188355.1 hypothetical protein [Alcanivorax limicola]